MTNLRINLDRLKSRLDELGSIGAIEGGGVRRLALTEEDREARDLLSRWFERVGADVVVDRLGNQFGIREGEKEEAPVMVGSHLDTVTTGGLYDGALGVLCGLEILEVLEEEKITTPRPLAVANFTNEEGVRFTPGMMGSRACREETDAGDLLSAVSADGSETVGEALKRIGYDGTAEIGSIVPHRFLELHIEQGPVLEDEEVDIGAVEQVQGIYWTEYVIEGESGHAGTTPTGLRRDAGYVSSRIALRVRKLAEEYGGVGTVGMHEISPNATNVIPQQARLRVDFRHPDKAMLEKRQELLDQFVREACEEEGAEYRRSELIRVDPVAFDPGLVKVIEEKAKGLGHPVRRMPSGAGHDAMMMAGVCPSAMLFVPSVDGISHNVNEYTRDEHLEAGANVLLHTVLKLLNR